MSDSSIRKVIASRALFATRPYHWSLQEAERKLTMIAVGAARKGKPAPTICLVRDRLTALLASES